MDVYKKLIRVVFSLILIIDLMYDSIKLLKRRVKMNRKALIITVLALIAIISLGSCSYGWLSNSFVILQLKNLVTRRTLLAILGVAWLTGKLCKRL